MGYHLAYGQEFLDTGRVVSDDSFIAPPVTAEDVEEGQLPPGAGFDDEGRYHFPNANWGSQVILARLWNRGRWTALSLALPALIILIAAGQAAILHRLRVPLVWLAPVWLALGVVGHERFLLRPELLAFACLTWQVWLLCGRITWPRVVAFIALQLVAVNLHSYWLLGAGVALAFAADAAARAAWGRWVTHTPLPDHLRRRLIRLALCAAAMAPAAMVHPGGAANAVFPFRTLAFLRTHQIQGRSGEEVSQQWRNRTLHPWQTIGEFHAPFAKGLHRRSTWGLALLLALAAAGIGALSIERRWVLAALLAAFSLAALSMRRNMIIPAIFAGPLIAAAAHGVVAAWRKAKDTDRTPAIAAVTAQAVLILIAGWWLFDVVSNRMYIAQRRTMHFGGGGSRLVLPLGPCRWLDEHLPDAQPAFVDQNLSSSVVFFSEKVTGVPSLTNTWATPPARMNKLFELGGGRLPLETLDTWEFDVLVVQGWQINQVLIRRLLASNDWALVHIETWFLTFVRRTDAHAELIAAAEITPESFDTAAFIATCRQADPIAALALKAGAGTLQIMGWPTKAAEVWQACLDDPAGAGFHEAWLNRGNCLVGQARERVATFNRQQSQGRPGDRRLLDDALADLVKARASFRQALQLDSDYPSARKNLRQVDNDIFRLSGRR